MAHTPYTDISRLQAYYSVNSLSKLLLWDGTPNSVTGSNLATIISDVSADIDTWLAPEYGSSIPLTSGSIPEPIQKVATFMTLEVLFTRASQQIPEGIQSKIRQSYSLLEGLANKTITVPGLVQDNASGIGGHIFSNTQEGTNQPQFVRQFGPAGFNGTGL